MTTGFQQQDPAIGICIPKSAPIPQHGRKADKACKKIEKRPAPPPQPGH